MSEFRLVLITQCLLSCASLILDPWAPAAGGQEGALAPPLEIQKYGGPPKDILTRKKFSKFFFKN